MVRIHLPVIIEYPNCAKCGTPTRIVAIEPDKPGHEKRTFICSECEHRQSLIVKYQIRPGADILTAPANPATAGS
jgi:hypothetical protein